MSVKKPKINSGSKINNNVNATTVNIIAIFGMNNILPRFNNGLAKTPTPMAASNVNKPACIPIIKNERVIIVGVYMPKVVIPTTCRIKATTVAITGKSNKRAIVLSEFLYLPIR